MQTVEQMLQNESNPDVLREIALFINQQANLIAEENKQLREERAREEAAKQAWLHREISCQLNKLRSRYFDHGRESLRDCAREGSENELLMHARSLVGDVQKNEISKKLPTEEIQCFANRNDVLVEAQQKDPLLVSDSAEISEISGLYETSSEISITERTYTRVIYKRLKYRVKNKVTGKEQIVCAPGPLKLLPGCRYSVDFALSVVAGKFLNHLPYERQRKDMRRLGVHVPVITMYRLSEQVAVHLGSAAESIRKDIFEANLACHLDETRWPILSRDADNGQMWVLSNQAGSYYRFEPSRSGKIADELLKNYSGPILTDKFSGYLHFRGQRVWGLCWAHARREFWDLRKTYPAEVKEVVTLVDDLAAIERRGKTWDQLKTLRATKSVEKLEEIKALLEKYRVEFFDRDDFCKAVQYVLGAWTEFTAFVNDTRLPLSNNDAERALRHAVLGRKNFNGSKTINGADTAAILYSVIESCKKVKLDPVDYMKYVITENQCDKTPLSPLKLARQRNKK